MIDGLDKIINDAIIDGAFPGANYCLISKGKKYFNSLGYKALFPHKVTNNIDTIYDMASCSKVLATTSIIYLMLQKGKLRLDDPVSFYLKDFKLKEITIWDIMTHTSGLPPMVSGAHKMTRDEILNAINNITTSYEKHTKIVYSDVGYIILGLVIESIAKMSLDEVAKTCVFEPLEMIDTCYNPQDNLRVAPTEDRGEYIDLGYVHDETAHNLGGVAGHAGVFSTVKDISNFMEMILNDGVYKGKRFFSKRIMELMFTPQIEEKDGISLRNYRRGLGWILQGNYCPSGDLCSKETIMHTGFTGTHIFIDRINQVAFCMLTNRVHPTRANTKIIGLRGRIGNYIMGATDEDN